MRMMKRFSLAIAGLIVAVVALAPGIASAKMVQLGQTATPIAAPACPKGVKPSPVLHHPHAYDGGAIGE